MKNALLLTLGVLMLAVVGFAKRTPANRVPRRTKRSRMKSGSAAHERDRIGEYKYP